ncbi:hypothetical protein [Constantimarinum furrinae]|uniref:Uncharacterized protein n=1 Tax=Constantimarinum furrinae TaxID=2562285 RepID=A0A7G8PRT1_9FLAO|nr:hypothetical protein [Constantimarinum furrinae]QNJ97047.1 hypothetical protein ALE3EI_0464 [Constantimarinum furrinae]
MVLKLTVEDFKKYLLDFIEKSEIKEMDRLKLRLSDLGNEKNDYKSMPRKVSLGNIRSKGETAFQRGIFNSQNTLLDYGNTLKEVNWLDLEIPVVLNKNPRRPSLDLIGITSDDIPVICELKYHKSKSDHPIYGIVELLMYYYYILCNHELLDKYDIHHTGLKKFEWSFIANFESPKLLLVANKRYWNRWLNRIGEEIFSSQMKYFKDNLNVNIECFSTDDEDFEAQKGDCEKYIPVISSNRWLKVI